MRGGSQKKDRGVRVWKRTFFGKRGVGPGEELTISSHFLSPSHLTAAA